MRASGTRAEYGVRMAVQEPITGFAVAVVREDGRWRCSSLDPGALAELDAYGRLVRAALERAARLPGVGA